ncbi:MAG TPA: radical SAM protein [Terriglobales bacterium]|nr:radical SAM protein [Terriglobales bacterium]
MDQKDVFKAWGTLLGGRKPLLSIELTKECPLHCPGCYAYDPQHLGGGITLRSLSDEKGDSLVARVLEIVDELLPLHLSIVGGDPLVRFRELQILLPEIAKRNIYVQLVTSAFRPIPAEWKSLRNCKLVVSIDGLPAEHDKRRAPATYDRVLKNVAGHQITVHCTLTSQMFQRPGYLEEFLQLWQRRPEANQIWISMFTPQVGSSDAEILSREQREFAVSELLRLLPTITKLDMSPSMLHAFLSPPHSPEECVFSQVTETISADLTTRITPCQFGGFPDCGQCGCAASMGLHALLGTRKLGGLPVRKLFNISNAVGKRVRRFRAA